MKMFKIHNLAMLSTLTAAVVCTAGNAWGQRQTNSLAVADDIGQARVAHGGGVDGASCGGTQITQNTDPDNATAGTVRCGGGTPAIPTDNFYARSFLITQPTNVNCIDFAVRSNSGAAPTPSNPWPVRVRMYVDSNGGAPDTASLQLIAGSEATVTIPVLGVGNHFFTVNYNPPILIAPNTQLVVEIFQACRQTTCTPPGDGSSGLSLGSNSAGESAPTYIKAPACGGLGDYVTMASINFPNIHNIINLGTTGSNPCAVPLKPCRADVDPPGVGNGVVNVNDLLAVINTWGQTQNPPGSGPRPQGDCDPLPNGNCLVNVNDLLTVINAWGNCPVPTGRCCFSDGTCQVLTSANCSSAGGNYAGDGTNCSPNPCPVAPVNDECAGAIQVFNGANNIDTTGATDSAGIPGGACIFGGAANIRKDVWHRYVATCNGEVTIDHCATTGNVTDSTLQVYTGPCGNLVEVACDDDSCTGNTAAGDRSRAVFTATQGTEYFIRSGIWGATNTPGPMVLTIGCVVFNPDNCNGATALTLGQQQCGNLSTATQDTAPTCNGVSVTKGFWYKVTGNGNTLTATLCGSDQNQFYDARLSVFCGLDCNNLFCVVAANNDTCALFETVSWCAAQGQTYWILVHTDNTAGQGQYCINVTSGAACNNPVPCLLPGDECVSPLGPLVLGNNANLTNAGMTNSPETASCLPAGDFTRDVWYNFTAGTTGPHTFSMCASTQANFDATMAIYSGACGSLVEVGCNDDFCGGGSRSQVTANLTSGTLYKVRIGSWQNSPSGTFDLNIIAGLPTGACCNGTTCTGVVTQAACNAVCGAFWTQDTACASCSAFNGVLACPNGVSGNGPADGVNGLSPNIATYGGWSPTFGLLGGFDICNAPANVGNFRLEFIDLSTPSGGSLSSYQNLTVKVYAFPGSGNLEDLDPTNPGTPLINQTFTVGVNATKVTTGQVFFGGDVERWQCTMAAPVNLPVGRYAIFVTMGTQSGTAGYFLATGAPTGKVVRRFTQWGITNASSGNLSIFWSSGSTSDLSVCIGQ